MTGQNPFSCKESWGLVIHICPTQLVVQALQWKWWIVIEFDAYNNIENDLHVELFVYSTTTTYNSSDVALWWNFEANKNQ